MTTPPERLRTELERHRQRGRPFSSAWPASVSAALADEGRDSQVVWRQTRLREQRAWWSACYAGPNVTRRLCATEPEHRSLSRTFVAR